MPSRTQQLKPEIAMQLHDWQLFARGVIEGINGRPAIDRRQRFQLEFKEHRQYVKGDEIRSIDWKLFGKTDRLNIASTKTKPTCKPMILLDQSARWHIKEAAPQVSASMPLRSVFGGVHGNDADRQQDAVALCTF